MNRPKPTEMTNEQKIEYLLRLSGHHPEQVQVATQQRLEKEKVLQEQRAKEMAERALLPQPVKKEKKEKPKHNQAHTSSQHNSNGSFEYFAGGRFECAPSPDLLPLPSFISLPTNGVRHSHGKPNQRPSNENNFYQQPATNFHPSPHQSARTSLNAQSQPIKSSPHHSPSMSQQSPAHSPSQSRASFQSAQQFLAQFQLPPPVHTNSNGVNTNGTRNLDHYAAYNSPNLFTSPTRPLPSQQQSHHEPPSDGTSSEDDIPSPLLFAPARAIAVPTSLTLSPVKQPQFLNHAPHSPKPIPFVSPVKSPNVPSFLNTTNKQPQFLTSHQSSSSPYASPYESANTSPISHHSYARTPQFLSPQNSRHSSPTSVPLLYSPNRKPVNHSGANVEKLFFDINL